MLLGLGALRPGCPGVGIASPSVIIGPSGVGVVPIILFRVGLTFRWASRLVMDRVSRLLLGTRMIRLLKLVLIDSVTRHKIQLM